MKRILVISPHPDDEAIGCGGAICKHVDDGDRVQVVFLTSGEKGGHGKSEAETQSAREREAEDAARILRYDELEFWRLPDGALEATDATIGQVRTLIEHFVPDLLYVPHAAEMHPDHQAAHRIVSSALLQLQEQRPTPTVLAYEVWTPIQRIDVIVDITEFMEIKLAAVRAYRTQCDVLRFDEAVRGLNRYRGEMYSWPGGDYAEVFVAGEPAYEHPETTASP